MASLQLSAVGEVSLQQFSVNPATKAASSAAVDAAVSAFNAIAGGCSQEHWFELVLAETALAEALATATSEATLAAASNPSQPFSAVGESDVGDAEMLTRIVSAPELSAVGDKERVNRVLVPKVKQETKVKQEPGGKKEKVRRRGVAHERLGEVLERMIARRSKLPTWMLKTTESLREAEERCFMSREDLVIVIDLTSL